MEGQGKLKGRMIFIIAIIITNANLSYQYFSYENCGQTCREQGLPCNIIMEKKAFEIQCVEMSDCVDQSSDDVPCISNDRPTLGGFDTWPLFKRQIKPKPKESQSCLGWKVWVTVQSGIELIIVMFWVIRKYRRYRARMEYESITEPSEDAPYRPTVEPIPPTEE